MHVGGFMNTAILRPGIRPRVRYPQFQVIKPVITPIKVIPVVEQTIVIPEIVEVITPASKPTKKISIFAIVISFFVVISAIFNIKQSSDVDTYKVMIEETQRLVKNMTTVVIPPVTATVIAKVISPSELKCMAENIYFEAARESLVGKIAVGQVVLNRMKSPNYPKTICGVVHQKNGTTCMFSWTCEEPKEIVQGNSWKQSQQVAQELLSKSSENTLDITEGSTHFHGIQINPGWNNLKPTAKIDGHQFYR